jgi:hypothetical protein
VIASADGRGSLRALRQRDFRLISIGNMVSQFGFWGQYVAVGWAARTLTSSDSPVTMAFPAQFPPTLVVSPIASGSLSVIRGYADE